MANIFDSILVKKGKRNLFNLKHDHMLTCDMGELIPVMVQDCIPGDKFTITQKALGRLAPLVAPTMGKLRVKFFTYFVPDRLSWVNFPEFIYNQGTFVFPTVEVNQALTAPGTLADYLGIPSIGGVGYDPLNVSAIPFSVYQRIWNDCFRDQNQQDDISEDIALADGVNVNAELFVLRKKAWAHDYFTSALPTPQAGDPVTIPLAAIVENVPVRRDNTGTAGDFVYTDGGGTTTRATADDSDGAVADSYLYAATAGLEVGPTTIEDLTIAKRLQEWKNKLMRGGKRFFEGNWNFFGVKSDDARLQRPEFVFSTSSPLIISEVLNTAGAVDAGGPPQANMSGHGVSVVGGQSGHYYCKEHGYLMTLMCVEPEAVYYQGVAKHWLRRDFTDYFFKEFAHLGEQEIVRQEIYVDESDSTRNDLFGYMVRYAEYRYQQSRISGEFKTTLNFWTWARTFDGSVALNEDFIECTPTKDPFAVTDGTDCIYMHVVNDLLGNREIPKYGTPMFG